MSVSPAEFWNLLLASRLAPDDQIQQLVARYRSVKGADTQGNAKTLTEWLIAEQQLTRYQATILLGGRSGPFWYGDYRIHDRVAAGRLQGRFRAIHQPTGQAVLLQFVSDPDSQDPPAWLRTAEWAAAQCQIEHPNLLRCFELVDLETYRFLVLEDLQGQAVDELLAQRGPFSLVDACHRIRQAALGLSRLHHQGLVHGDLRPGNLWIDSSNNVKLLRDPLRPPQAPDFARGGAELLAQADYLAPEFAQAGKTPDHLTDIYALGCSFYQMLTGRPPFAGGDVPQKLGRHAAEPIQPLESFGVPQPIAQTVSYLMAKNPSIRYQHIGAVIDQLNAFVAPEQLHPRFQPDSPTLSQFEHWLRTHRQPPRTVVNSPSPTGSPPPAPNSAPDALPSLLPAKQDAGEAFASAAMARPPVATIGAPVSADSTNRGLDQDARHRKQTRGVAVWLTAAGGMMITALILLNVFQRQQPANSEGATDTTPASSAGARSSSGDGPNDANRATTSTDHSSPPQPVPRRLGSGSPNSQLADDPPDNSSGQGIAAVQVVDDPGGRLLWASPTNGQPVSFRYVPPDTRLYLIVRPASLIACGQGPLVLQALGPAFSSSLDSWQHAAGVQLSEIDQLIMTLHDGPQHFPRPAFVVHMKKAVPKPEMLQRWGNPSEMIEGASTIYQGRDYAYYSRDREAIKSFLMGPAASVRDVAQVSAVNPPLQREFNALRQASDDDRHVTVIFQPQYVSAELFRDGQPWYFGDPRKVRQPLERFLGDDVKACLFSMHCDGNCYLELRVHGAIDVSHRQRAEQLKQRLQQIPDQIRSYIVTLSQHPYWEAVRIQYPQMIRALHRYCRVGVEGEHAVINCILPDYAAHNLVFGSEMVLSSPVGVARPIDPAPAADSARTINDVLAAKVTIAFDQESLESAISSVASEAKQRMPDVDFRIRILGDDLKLDGITRNQQIRDFRQQDATIADVLTALVMRANPVTTVTSPAEKDQKLLWVVGPDPEDGRPSVLITTRQVAEQKYNIPEVFRRR